MSASDTTVEVTTPSDKKGLPTYKVQSKSFSPTHLNSSTFVREEHKEIENMANDKQYMSNLNKYQQRAFKGTN